MSAATDPATLGEPTLEGVMNGTCVIHRPRRASPPAARIAAAIIATAGLALLVSACGSGSPSTTVAGRSSTARGSANSQLVAFSRCMRSNRVPNFPDPQRGQTNAKFPGAQQLRVSSSQYLAAEGACAHLLPNAGQATPAASAQMLSKMVLFSQCMRSHGVPNWPDPTSGPDGTPGFNLVGINGIPEQSSPEFQNAIHECGHLVPHALGGIRVRQSLPAGSP